MRDTNNNQLKISILLFFVLCFSIFCINSQILASFPKNTDKMETIDSAFIKVWYALNAVDINDTKTYDDMQCLEIGTNTRKYYSYLVYKSDSSVTALGKKNKGAGSTPRSIGNLGKTMWTQYKYSEFLTYQSKNSFIEYTNMPLWMNRYNCFYEEKIPFQLWQIKSDTMTVAGFLCQKAECNFRGRDFVAWFTPKIPVNSGPWKFNGLPGLILKVQDKDMHYIFECIGIAFIEKKHPIRLYESYKKYPKTERNKLLKLQNEIGVDWVKVVGAIREDGKKPVKNIFYPLELE